MATILLAIVLGALVFSVLSILAAIRYLRVPFPTANSTEAVSILKPLSGLDDNLESNLRTFFEQNYPAFEILFAVRHANDPAVAVVEKLQLEYPQVPTRLLVTGEPPCPNAKVFSLSHMLKIAANDLVVMSDSDIRAPSNLLRNVAAEFQDVNLGVATCPYRAVPADSFWSRLEATGLNTDFLSGILVARMLEGMKFAVGGKIAARRRALDGIGGFERLKDYLAEDFVMGKFVADAGYSVILSSQVVEHCPGSSGLRQNAAHRLRWVRSTRRSRPAGYIGQLFTMPLPLALILWIAQPGWWVLAAATILMRAVAGWATAGLVLKDGLTAKLFWLVPLQDVLSLAMWVGGFF